MNPAARGWVDLTAALDAAVRELPGRRMHLDPRLRVVPPGSEASGDGLVLRGDWSAPALAGAATGRACAEGGLLRSVASAASAVARRTVSSAVAAGAGAVTVKVTASAEGAYVSLRAGFPAPAGVDGQRGTSAARTAPWEPGGSARRCSGVRGAPATWWLYGVAVDAQGLLLDRSDVVVWFEVSCGVAPVPARAPASAVMSEPALRRAAQPGRASCATAGASAP